MEFGAAEHARVVKDISLSYRLEQSVEDATRELALATKLHSSLCPCLMSCCGGAVSTETQTVFMLMPRMEFDLHKRIKSEPTGMREEDVRLYAASIICALETLHTVHRTVHLDVKPQNALLADGGRVLRLGDFGLATTADDCDNMELQVSCMYLQAAERKRSALT